MPTEPVVRPATLDDADALAALRWRWAVPDRAPEADELREFAIALRQWMAGRGERSHCTIAVLDGDLVGMAWLAVFDRVPNPRDLDRRSGDVQSVFVLPEHQGKGIGDQLVRALCATADQLGIRKLTLDSREPVVSFYERFGFASTGTLMERPRPTVGATRDAPAPSTPAAPAG